ncbi:hypothetical protein [Microbacterium sp. UFMG61]|uniref:hypothetical protein n=1 Tax=Microbacterium sp. UFMG61 TaxID=2745935 RepID=UPI00188FD28C|nr:hypothetical protein [Microbacterium sp. UFMG61]
MIGRALRAQARSFSGDIVLCWVSVASIAMALSLVTSIPPEFATADAADREAFAAPFSAVTAMYGAVLASVYGCFRYTVDRRDGVIAQRLMLQPRWATLVARLPAAALGGAIVALTGVLGGHLGLAVAVGGVPVEWGSVWSSLALGAAAGVWGVGVGIIVQAHLVALFLVSASMGSAILVAVVWKAGAVYLPLLAMLEALRFDLGALGVAPEDTLDGVAAALVAVGWLLAILVAAGAVFMRRDVR